VLTEHCVLHYLELPKVEETLNDPLSRWLYYIKNGPKEDEKVKVLLDDDHDIRAAHERYRRFTEDDEAREAYEARMKFLRDQANREEMARDEGREEGEHRRAQAIAARLKASGMDDSRVSELTGLTVDEVEAL
jgi:predicted transposase/invertase (TIGR01784 family)